MSSTPFPDSLSREIARAAAASRLLVASDFDGTMAAIVDVPGDARSVPETQAAMTELSQLASTITAVVSGRSLEALHQLTALPSAVHLVGSHGMEFDSSFAAGLSDKERARLDELNRQAAGLADRFPGLEIERKPASTALHYRHVTSDQQAEAVTAIHDGPQAIPGVHTTAGKAVVEIAAIETNKGFALDRLRIQEAADLVVFIGDDVTDEFAFAALRPGDLGIKVGPGETAATERVADVNDVARVLTELAAARREHLEGSR